MRGKIFLWVVLFLASFHLVRADKLPWGYHRCDNHDPNCRASLTVYVETRGYYTRGSGSVVSEDGLILTDAHVIGEETDVAHIMVREEIDGKVTMFKATLVNIDFQRDLAYLWVPRHFSSVVQLGSSVGLPWGTRLHAISTPTGKFHQVLTSVYLMGRGIFWGDYDTTYPKIRTWMFLVQIVPGSSGGGIFDEQGRLVGMIQRAGLKAYVHFTYAIPVETVRSFIKDANFCSGVANICLPQ